MGLTHTFLSHRFFYFTDPVRTLEYLARLGAIRRTHDAVPLHEVD